MNSEFCVAVHGLVYLNHMKRSLNSTELAENICTNPARVRKVMAQLKKAGLITTREGIDGGYTFEGDPAGTDLRQIGDALGMSYVGTAWKSGDPDMDCLVASGMAGIMEDIFRGLDESCRERLKGITIKDIDDKIFGGMK